MDPLFLTPINCFNIFGGIARLKPGDHHHHHRRQPSDQPVASGVADSGSTPALGQRAKVEDFDNIN